MVVDEHRDLIKKLNEVKRECLVEIELALRDLDPEQAGAWDTVQGLMLQVTSTRALAGLSALAEAAGEAGADAFESGLHGLASPSDPIRHLSPLLSWRWKPWRRWLKASKPS
mgnify:CR=1 FL=1